MKAQIRTVSMKVSARSRSFLLAMASRDKGWRDKTVQRTTRSFGPHESKITKAFICRFCSFRAHASKVTRRNETRFLVTYVRHAPAAYTYSGVRERFTGSALLSRQRLALNILFPRSRFSLFLSAYLPSPLSCPFLLVFPYLADEPAKFLLAFAADEWARRARARNSPPREITYSFVCLTRWQDIFGFNDFGICCIFAGVILSFVSWFTVEIRLGLLVLIVYYVIP